MKYLVLLVLLASCSVGAAKPKYKNGTCLKSETTFIVEVVFVKEVDQKFEYTIDIYTDNGPTRSYLSEENLELNEFKVVECPQGEN